MLQQSSGKQLIFSHVFHFQTPQGKGKEFIFSVKLRKTRTTWSNVQDFKDIQEDIISVLALNHSLLNSLIDYLMSMTACSHYSRNQLIVVSNYISSNAPYTSKYSG